MVAEQLRRRVPGGIGTYARGVLLGLSRLDPTVRPSVTLYASRPPRRPDPLAILGWPVVSSKLPGPMLTRLWDLGLRGPRALHPGVVHAVSMSTPAPHKGQTLAVTVHDLAWRVLPDAFPPRGRAWHEAALARAARRADVFIVPSEYTADHLVSAGAGIREDRVTVIAEGADHLPDADVAAARLLLDHRGVHGSYLLAVGTLEPRKNLVRLFRAYSTIRSELPEPWPLVVVGPSGWGRPPGTPTATAGEGVVFLGEVEEAVLAGLYSGARCVAYVPLIEGFGLPVVEAMREGTPVVATAVPSSGGATIVVPAEDCDAIAAGLVIAATDGARRDALIAEGYRRADSLTWIESARSHLEVWRRLS